MPLHIRCCQCNLDMKGGDILTHRDFCYNVLANMVADCFIMVLANVINLALALVI